MELRHLASGKEELIAPLQQRLGGLEQFLIAHGANVERRKLGQQPRVCWHSHVSRIALNGTFATPVPIEALEAHRLLLCQLGKC
jgi:hypothetical protein